jgi:hypothetical protein
MNNQSATKSNGTEMPRKTNRHVSTLLRGGTPITTREFLDHLEEVNREARTWPKEEKEYFKPIVVGLW